MEKTINFIEWVINNSSNDIVQGIIEKYKHEEKYDDEENMVEEIQKEEGILKGIIHEKFSKKRKLEITITEYNETNYIFFEEIKLKQDMITWEKTSKMKMTLHKMERIIRRAYEILNR